MATSIEKFVRNNAVSTAAAVIGTTSPSPVQTTQGWPLGDIIYERINMRVSGALQLTTSSAGTAVSQGELVFLRQVILSTPAQNNLIDGLDGVMLYDMMTFQKMAVPKVSDVSAVTTGTPAWESAYEFTFSDPLGLRYEDEGLHVARVNAMLLQTQYGVIGDFITGGTYTGTYGVGACNEEIDCKYQAGPINVAKDGPLLMAYKGVLKVPITATAKQFQILLSYGDRVYKRLFITQRNGSTLARLNNTIVGANDQDRFSIKFNSLAFKDNLEWLALQDKNINDYRIPAASSPNGVAVADFFPWKSGGGLMSDALSVITPVPGVLELDIDVTTGSNYQIWLGYDCAKAIPPAAFVQASQAGA